MACLDGIIDVSRRDIVGVSDLPERHAHWLNPNVSFQFPRLALKGAQRTCSIGASNGWHTARDLMLTAEQTGDRRIVPRAPLCRR